MKEGWKLPVALVFALSVLLIAVSRHHAASAAAKGKARSESYVLPPSKVLVVAS